MHKPSSDTSGFHCPTCDYDLTGLIEHRCPECGAPFDPSTLRQRRAPVRVSTIARNAAAAILASVGAGTAGIGLYTRDGETIGAGATVALASAPAVIAYVIAIAFRVSPVLRHVLFGVLALPMPLLMGFVVLSAPPGGFGDGSEQLAMAMLAALLISTAVGYVVADRLGRSPYEGRAR